MRSDVQLVPGPPPPRIQKAESGYRYFPLPVVCILSSDGAVAQLGERELCKLEVVGSIPIGSTNRYPEDKGSETSDGNLAMQRIGTVAGISPMPVFCLPFSDTVKAGLAGRS